MLEEIGAALEAFEHVSDVRLLEIRLRGVQDDRLPALELVVQDAGQAGVPPLGHARGVQGRRPLGRIVVDLEVLGLDDLEIEGLVLDLVLSEVLRCQRRRAEQRERRRDPDHASHDHHPFDPLSGAPAASTGASPHRRSSW